MPRLDQRTALDTLPRPRLLEIATAFDLGTGSRHRKSELVDALASSPRSSFPRILELLRRDELKAICRVAGLDDSGREKARIVERILHEGLAQRSAMPRSDLETVTRAELAEDVADATGLSRVQAEVVLNIVLESLAEAISSGSRVEIRGFGSFGLHHRKARIGRNPATGAKVDIPARDVPFFKPGKELRKIDG